MVHDVLAEVTRASGIHKTYVVTGSSEVVDWVSDRNVSRLSGNTKRRVRPMRFTSPST